MPPSTPLNLTDRTHRLSQLPGNHSLTQCAGCGASGTAVNLSRWQEHDHRDNPEPRVVVLCKHCSGQLIEQHPRLYRKISAREFVPGSAQVCGGCHWQSKLSCACPIAKFNGGTGLQFKPMPSTAHLCAGRNSRWVAFEVDPVTECSGKQSPIPI